MPPRERGRPARNLIGASSLRSRGIPSNRAPNRPLQGSLLWCQVLCGRDARAPGWVPPATLLVQAACDPGAFPRTEHQTGLCRVRYFGAKSYAGETPALPGGSRPQPYSCKQPAIQGHSLEQSTKPAFAGFATMVPSPMRARRPRSRVGILPFTLAPQESVSGCRAAALPCRSCERASCNIGSGTGHFAGNRDVLPISIVGCDLVKKGSSPQKAQKSQNQFRDFESWQSAVDPHGDGLTGCMQIARNLCDGFGSQRLAGFQCSALFVFLCLLWPSPAKVTLPNFAKGSSLRRLVRHFGSPAFTAAAYAARHPNSMFPMG